MSEDNQGHGRFMRRCIELAREAKQQGNTPVGSVVVLDGEITGEGMEQLPTSLLLTGHAEALLHENRSLGSSGENARVNVSTRRWSAGSPSLTVNAAWEPGCSFRFV